MMKYFIIVIQKLLIMLDSQVGIINLNKSKHPKKINEELMPVVWHPTRQWYWCLPENEKKKIKPIFTDKVGK